MDEKDERVNRRMEILAPAGDAEMLRAAVYSGADCVYLGVRGFNARRGAQNFEGQSLAQAVAFCHARNCGVYAAVNTLVLPGRNKQLEQAIYTVAEAGCDAVIVQDLAVAAMVRAIAPGLPLHASTQMSVHSPAGVQMLAELGFQRAILARELHRDELAAMAENAPIELEVFVHGALCVSVSGQCLMSAFLGGRSANRGACAGPCRLPFCAALGTEPDGEVALRGDAMGVGRASHTPNGPGTPKGTHKPTRRGGMQEVRGTARDGGTRTDGEEAYHLSLQDLSILDALPELEKMGIAAAKIEGRLRGPEYCAVVVDSARKALDGEEYDRGLLQDVFSRSGFTRGWYGLPERMKPARGEAGSGAAQARAGQSPAMPGFGVRTPADATAAKAAQAKARALYRREMPRVPVEMELVLGTDGGRLQVSDGEHCLRKQVQGPLPVADANNTSALRQALEKTGGTPFYLPASKPPRVETGGLHLATAQVAALRRAALEELLALRQQPSPHPVHRPPRRQPAGLLSGYAPAVDGKVKRAGRKDATEDIQPLWRKRTGDEGPALRARFAGLWQMPPEAAEACEALLLPLREAAQVPQALRHKTVLYLPRVLFGEREAAAALQVAEAATMGFAGFEAQNLAHLALCKGRHVAAGFGLNCANATTLEVLAGLGCQTVTLSPELSLPQMRDLLAEALPAATDALCYGHIPLMVTRACPLQNMGAACGADCPKTGSLMDRKGHRMQLRCEDGVRHIFNPVPLWMADRLAELPTDWATLYFTTESREQAAQVLAAFATGVPAAGTFTRGLYDRGTEG